MPNYGTGIPHCHSIMRDAIIVPTLRIQAATYGGGNKLKDVTGLLNDKIVVGRLELVVSNEHLGGDPIYGVEKNLTLIYWHSGNILSKTVKENGKLTLP